MKFFNRVVAFGGAYFMLDKPNFSQFCGYVVFMAALDQIYGGNNNG